MLGFVGIMVIAFGLAACICALCFMRWWVIIPLGLSLFVLLAVPVIAFGRDLDGKYADSPWHDWVSNLRNPAGGLCCDLADGHRIDDIDWRDEPDGTYSVRINGEWTKLEKDQIVIEPNKMGIAMVWIWNGKITCFIAGPRA